MKPDFKCGLVALIGNPNAGKSTLLNALVGCSVAITTSMAGTTREAVRGILNTADAQIIFVDTPGMQRATNLLERKMNREISGAVKSADLICYVIDVTHLTPAILQKLENYRDFGIPVVVALTKIDCVKPEKVFAVLEQLSACDFVQDFVPVAALKNKGVKTLVECLVKHLPFAAPQYPFDEYTDSQTRQMAAEIIRGAIINNVRDEIPAGVKVTITTYEQVKRTINISADIICDKPNHKKIIIGSQGKMIHKIGCQARTELEKLLGGHIVLKTHVLVRAGWRDRSNFLQD